jgi:golgi SNAP receptor complex member 1
MDPQTAAKVRMWESLRADARQEDAVIENKLSILERVALSETPDDATESRFHALTQELNEQIQQMQRAVLSMHDASRSMPPTTETAAMLKHTQRFDDIVAEKFAIVRRLGVDFQKRRERSQLLGKVKQEIESYRESEEFRHLSSENESLRHTQRRLNDILSQADLTRDKLHQQRQTFVGMADKVVTIAEKVPFINGLLKKIDAKRRREVVILASLTAFLMFLVFLFW